MLFRTLVFMLSIGASSSPYAFDMDMHYYVSAYIWSHFNSGAKLNDAQIIAARSNQFTDDNMEVTGPSQSGTTDGARQRRNWHFPAEFKEGSILNYYGITTRNSVYAKHVVNKALETNNPYQLGMAMHTYLDSFAHEGYAGRIGHASAGHDPDRPHLDPDKFREATFMMGQIIRQWFINNGLPMNASPIDLNLIHETANFVPNAWWCSGYALWLSRPDCYGNTYEGNEIPERVDYWVSKLDLDNKLIPDYSMLEGADKQNFNFAAAAHIVPAKAEDALGMEWFYKDWSGKPFPLSIATHQSQVSQNLGDIKTKADVKAKAVNQAALARDVIKNPDSYVAGIPYQLESARGVNQLLKAASKNENGWQTLTMLAGAPHSNWDWNPLWKYVRKYLKADNKTHAFLFAMSVASNVEATDMDTCTSIDSFLKKYDYKSHGAEDNLLFFNAISPKSDFISVCAKESINALKSLSDDVNFEPLVAAKLSSIASDEISNPMQTSRGKSEMVRWNAINTLRNIAEEALIENSKSQSVMPAEIASSVEKWFVIAEQDFDDDIHNSLLDKVRLNDLEHRLEASISKGDKIGISPICSAIATYDKSDLDNQSLVELLKTALADPYFNDDADELSYALLSLSN